MIEGFSLGNYVLLLEYTGRLFREGKAVISGELAGVFERLGSNAENWQARLQKLAAGRLLGRFFAASRARLREVAERLGVHHLANLGGSRRDDADPKAGFQARLHFTLPETLARVGRFCRKLSMSESCGWSLTTYSPVPGSPMAFELGFIHVALHTVAAEAEWRCAACVVL